MCGFGVAANGLRHTHNFIYILQNEIEEIQKDRLNKGCRKHLEQVFYFRMRRRLGANHFGNMTAVRGLLAVR